MIKVKNLERSLVKKNEELSQCEVRTLTFKSAAVHNANQVEIFASLAERRLEELDRIESETLVAVAMREEERKERIREANQNRQTLSEAESTDCSLHPVRDEFGRMYGEILRTLDPIRSQNGD